MTFTGPEPIRFWKYDWDKFTDEVDFTGKLPTGRTLASGTVAAYQLPGMTDVSSTILESTTLVMDIPNNKAQFTVKAGDDDTEYLIELHVVLDNAHQLEERVYMQVIGE